MTGSFRIQRWSNHPAPRWEDFVPRIADADSGRIELARVVANERGLAKLLQRSLRLVDGDGQVLDEWTPGEPEPLVKRAKKAARKKGPA